MEGDTEKSDASHGMTLRSQTYSPQPREKHVSQSDSNTEGQTSSYNLRATETRKRQASIESSFAGKERGKLSKHEDDKEQHSEKVAFEGDGPTFGFLPGMYIDTSQ